MTRDEALQAMINGHKVTHIYFTDDEYIYMVAQNIYSEEGYDFGTVNDEFWRNKNIPAFQNDWGIYMN